MNISKILVVDDEVRFCESISVFLTMEGFYVETALSVKEAVSLLRKKHFDLFLVDKMMPGQDGFVFMDYAVVHYPDVPFIMMTGKASVDSAIQALKKGAYDYLQKPFKYEELVNTVNNALAKKKLEAENKKITARLKITEKKYSDMINNSPDLFFMLDQKDCFTFINKTFETMLGYSMKDLQGKTLMELVHEDDREKVYFFLNDRRSTKSKRNALGTEVRMKCKAEYSSRNQIFDIEIKKSSASFYHDAEKDENIHELCIVGRDISYRKQFEEQLIYTQKMEAVGVLAAGVAHDFNNLLMNIQGQTSIIKMGVHNEDPCYEKLCAIERHISRGSNIAAQLLNFAKGGNYDIKPVNMNYVIKDMVELFSISSKNIQIHTDLYKELWPVTADICQMEQVFMNLFINARHAMPEGGDLFVKSENIELNHEEADNLNRSSGKYVKLTIKDTGCGIDKHIQKKIFDPFFTTRKRSEGTGLGLASAYGIIKKHHGVIKVDSEPDKGARFTIYLYASNNKLESMETPGQKQHLLISEISQDNIRQGVIIVIDDDPEILEQSASMLQILGFEVITAENGRDGVKRYLKDHDKIDLVVLDMVMPGLNGIETFEYIKKINPDSKVLITTGYKRTNEIDRLLKDEYSAFMKKPYRMKEMSEKLNILLKQEDGSETYLQKT